ncbi:protein FAR1-RELATED SEQUENCE 5-like [Trifolium pratense]|uniref:protein FAR1-RELATED SEQUENCE 5-like n=1 Tax=Trifolium pratense TaxID=57577 RepID=UPI001E694F54|nr:protein FAR1-RELATED SEQUENCE 5-like [Trifolium pratense]
MSNYAVATTVVTSQHNVSTTVNGQENMNSSLPNCVDSLVNNIQEQNVQQSIANSEPHLEMEFESEASTYDFYNAYSKTIGFGIRREYGNKSRVDGVLTSRRFTCFKEGIRSVDKRCHSTAEPRAETRTGCQARMAISLDRKIGKYKVVDFIAKHNHPLQPPEHVHMIRSHRRISEAQASQIVLGDESGLTPKDLHEYISKQAGGIETVGFTREDLKNYLKTKRKQSLKYGEVGALMMYFKQESENPSFFYDFQMDVDELITNIFWADAQMINDYGYFGDVITFDTTYKTNKDCWPLGVFVGLNNHRQTVIFGAALLYDETIPSFQWLFETFLKAMGGAKPKTMLTDQDPAMARALSIVMPETFNGLCTWHIRHNSLRHVNHLYQQSSRFCGDFVILCSNKLQFRGHNQAKLTMKLNIKLQFKGHNQAKLTMELNIKLQFKGHNQAKFTMKLNIKLQFKGHKGHNQAKLTVELNIKLQFKGHN